MAELEHMDSEDRGTYDESDYSKSMSKGDLEELEHFKGYRIILIVFFIFSMKLIP